MAPRARPGRTAATRPTSSPAPAARQAKRQEAELTAYGSRERERPDDEERGGVPPQQLVRGVLVAVHWAHPPQPGAQVEVGVVRAGRDPDLAPELLARGGDQRLAGERVLAPHQATAGEHDPHRDREVVLHRVGERRVERAPYREDGAVGPHHVPGPRLQVLGDLLQPPVGATHLLGRRPRPGGVEQGPADATHLRIGVRLGECPQGLGVDHHVRVRAHQEVAGRLGSQHLHAVGLPGPTPTTDDPEQSGLCGEGLEGAVGRRVVVGQDLQPGPG